MRDMGLTGITTVNVTKGMAALWDPLVIILLQLIWAGIFVYTGRSTVTGSYLSFHVHEERV
ncbi:MAG TPA: hypothetical protein VN416_00085 [Desulfomonilia bacterium]|nr:hypothetical protein [Desulfomonilia bacterium]